MSKEQTPITAEEKILKAFELTFLVKPKNIFDVMNLSVEEFVDVLDNFLHNEQKEAKAKVLEALEREFNHKDCININKTFFNSCGEFDILSASEYYETKVKPKYE